MASAGVTLKVAASQVRSRDAVAEASVGDGTDLGAGVDLGGQLDDGRQQPVRTCIGCRVKASRELLVRYVLGADGQTPVRDDTKSLIGRGAWLHDDPTCYELATRRRAFARALRASKTNRSVR